MKYILIIFCLSIYCVANGQTPPINNTIGSQNSTTLGRGVFAVDSGFWNRTNFADTLAPNKALLKNIPGLQIRVGDKLYLRNNAASQWIEITTGVNTNIYTSNGTIADPVRTVNVNGGKIFWNNTDTFFVNGQGESNRAVLTLDSALSIFHGESGIEDQSGIKAFVNHNLRLFGGKGLGTGPGVSIVPNAYGSGARVDFVEDAATTVYQSYISPGAQEIARIGSENRNVYIKGIADSTAVSLRAKSPASVVIDSSRFNQGRSTSVAAANNLTLPFDGNLIPVTGNTQINAITTYAWNPGSIILLTFTGSPIVKNNTAGGAGTAPIRLTTNLDWSATPGSVLTLTYDGTDWKEIGRAVAGGSSSLPPNFYFLSQYAVSDARVHQYSTQFGTDNTAAIQAILDLASTTNPIVVVVDGQFSHTGLRVKGNTTIWTPVRSNGMILRDGSNKSILSNYNISKNPAARLDSNIHIIGGTWNGNYAGQTELGNPTYGLVCGFQFMGVCNLTLEGFLINDHKTYAISSWNNKNYTVRDFEIRTIGGLNGDGVHADGNSDNVIIENGILQTGDDGVAVNADDNYINSPIHYTYPFYAGAQGDIVGSVRIRNIYFLGSAFGFRFLSTTSRIPAVYIDNVTGTNTVKLMELDQAGLINGPGNVGTIVMKNVDVKTTVTTTAKGIINVGTKIENLTIEDFSRKYFEGAAPTIKFESSGDVKNFNLINYTADDTSGTSDVVHIDMSAGNVTNFKIENPIVKSRTLVTGSRFLKVNGGGITKLSISNGEVENIQHVAHLRSGNLNYVMAPGLRHTGVQADSLGTFLIDTGKTIYDIVGSSYYGVNPLQVRGGGEALKVRGDMFLDPADTIPDFASVYDTLPFPIQYEAGVLTPGTLIDSLNYWKTLSTNGAYGHKGKSSLILTGDGAILMYANSWSAAASGGGVQFAFTADAAEPFIFTGLEFLGGNVIAYDITSTSPGTPYTAVVEAVQVNNWYKLERRNSRFYLSRSTSLAGPWTQIREYTGSRGGTMNGMCNIAGNSGPSLVPYRLNLPMHQGFTE